MNTIKLKYGLEDIVSRIPGLFAYIEFDENHVSTVHSASDSYVGCYGKIPCALRIPQDVSLVIDGVSVIKAENVYSYRTLMNVYYQYRDDYSDSSFIQFIERGIGKIETPFNKDWTLVPEYEYYANCARLYDEYVKIGKMCEKYQGIKDVTGEVNCELECLCDRYVKMGGDYMRDWYHSKITEATQVADEFRNYVVDEFNLRFDINIVSSSNDLGILNTYLDFFDPKHEYHKDEYTIYNDRTYICEAQTFKGEWDETQFSLLSEDYTYEEHPENIMGTTNSVLTGFRKSKNYLDEGGNIKLPEYGTDWLWYYRIGDVGYSETTNDLFSNVEIEEGKTRVETIDQYETHLMAYGDIIKNITRDSENKTITFEYIIGAHLKAKLLKIELDDDNNKHYFYSDYEYDEVDTQHGVNYTETYSYEIDSEINSMNDEDFNDYITREKIPFEKVVEGETKVIVNTYKKCEFSAWSKMVTNEAMINGVPKDYEYITTNFSTKFDTEKDTLVNPTMKLDYFNRVSYPPSVKSDVHITRGNAAAWEKHIRLSECVTFEDLENSSLFSIMIRTS